MEALVSWVEAETLEDRHDLVGASGARAVALLDAVRRLLA